MNYVDYARKIFDTEIESLIKVKNSIGSEFSIFTEKIRNCVGRVIITGMGKSGHISKKIVATMQSLGIKAYFLHPGEALHGDLGLLTEDDLVIALSNSGETEEILNIIPSIEKIGSELISILGRPNSSLQEYSSCSIILPEIKEVFLESLVPTSSTTSFLVLGDALAVTVAESNGFDKTNFGIFHPNGMLGKKLTLRVGDLMLIDDENSSVLVGSTVKNATFEMCRKPIGGVSIVNKFNELQGVFTDGDLRRIMNSSPENAMERTIDEIMTKKPITLYEDTLVSEVADTIWSGKNKLSFFPVVDKNNKLIGALRIIDVIKCGLMG